MPGARAAQLASSSAGELEKKSTVQFEPSAHGPLHASRDGDLGGGALSRTHGVPLTSRRVAPRPLNNSISQLGDSSS